MQVILERREWEVNRIFRHRKFINVQCSFRKNQSTLDHLVRLEAYVRKALAEEKRIVAVFMDLGKA